MKAIKYLLIGGTALFLSAFTINQSIKWKISEDYSVKFSGTKVEGVFTDLKGDVQFNESSVTDSKFSFSIAVNSINTGNGMKNKHAKSDKWFDAEAYPNITFKSSKVVKSGNGYQVTGDMNIHGISKEMTIPFTFDNNTFNSKFSVKRLDFKVGNMEGMSKKVSDEIKLDVSIPVIKA